MYSIPVNHAQEELGCLFFSQEKALADWLILGQVPISKPITMTRDGVSVVIGLL